MGLTGKILGTGIGRPLVGTPVVYEMIQIGYSPENMAYLASEASRWKQLYEQYKLQPALQGEFLSRVKFATEVMGTVTVFVGMNACCVIAAKDDFDHLLGLATYNTNGTEGYLNLQVIDPQHLAGSPVVEKIRGIGTAMTAVIARQMIKNGVVNVYLHPFDPAAASFWINRGFVVCGLGGLLCIRGQVQIEKLIDACITRPEAPDRGDIICCGQLTAVR